ncbi:hypothetical protein OS493_016540 [Desmophyllum pertusum]|uniref:UDP-sugar transporter protein SLC35A4 n=1 Tax=Desmophyllum pertusum TaxID=174260 RepID=A0A9W9ZPE2_9CNID|nr:hypothetical protein OS493_016540 [Desmophyllum pertusum]
MMSRSLLSRLPQTSPSAQFSSPLMKVLWKAMMVAGVLIYGSHAILINLCKDKNGKIPFSSASVVLLSEVIKNISEKQWTALGLITLAGCFNSYGGLTTAQDIINVRNNSTDTGKHIYVTTIGLLLMIVYCSMSGLAGISTEYILKRQYKLSLHLQNTLMYLYGMIFNLSAYGLSAQHSLGSVHDTSVGFFRGYSKWTVVIIFCQAMNGLILSAVMKHSSNLIRLLIIACAMIVNTALSMAIFSLQLNLYFNFAFILVIVALKLYHS